MMRKPNQLEPKLFYHGLSLGRGKMMRKAAERVTADDEAAYLELADLNIFGFSQLRVYPLSFNCYQSSPARWLRVFLFAARVAGRLMVRPWQVFYRLSSARL